MPSGIPVEPVAPQRILHGTAAKEFSKPAYVNSSGVGGQPILIPSPKTPQKKEGCVCVCVCVYKAATGQRASVSWPFPKGGVSVGTVTMGPSPPCYCGNQNIDHPNRVSSENEKITNKRIMLGPQA